MKKKLLASTATLDDIKKAIKEYFFGNEKELIEIDQNKWKIKGMSSYVIEFKANRYRFEVECNNE